MELLVAILCFILIYAGQSLLYKRFWNQGLELRMEFAEPYLEIGAVSYLVEEVANRKRLPLPSLHVKFSTDRSLLFSEQENAVVTDLYHRNDAISVMGGQKVTRKLEFQAQKRGLFFLSGIRLVAKDFLMSQTFAMPTESPAYVYVFPEKTDIDRLELILNGMEGDMRARKRLLPDPFVRYGARPYTTGDAVKSINWKLTARQDELMVNIYEPTVEYRVKIFLCLEPQAMIKTEAMKEMCIRLASGAASYFIERKIPVSVCAAAKDILSGKMESVSFGASSSHRMTVDKYLARLTEACGTDTFLELLHAEESRMQEETAYLVISAYQGADLFTVLDGWNERHNHVSMLSPYLDIQGQKVSRSYLYGWEVALDEI